MDSYRPNKTLCDNRYSTMSDYCVSVVCFRPRLLSAIRQLDHAHKRGMNNTTSSHRHSIVRQKITLGPMQLSLDSSDCPEESTLAHKCLTVAAVVEFPA